MAEQPEATQTEEQPIPNAPDGELNQQPAKGAEPQPPPETEEAPETDEGADDLWNETLPELGGARDQLSPEAREQLLLRRLAAQPQSRPATGDPADRPSPTDEAEAGAPPVAEIPLIDAKAQRQAIAKAIEDGDSDALADILDNHRAFVDGMGKLVYEAVKDQNRTIGDLGSGLKELRVPAQLKAALPDVPNATEADLAAASELLASGEVKKPETALKVAAFNRQSEIDAAKQTPRSASEEARRKGKALAASKLAGTSAGGGELARERIPVTQQQHAEDMRREAAQQQK